MGGKRASAASGAVHNDPCKSAPEANSKSEKETSKWTNNCIPASSMIKYEITPLFA
jgi:hypothetical protein